LLPYCVGTKALEMNVSGRKMMNPVSMWFWFGLGCLLEGIAAAIAAACAPPA
jgi:hypothetical protein